MNNIITIPEKYLVSEKITSLEDKLLDKYGRFANGKTVRPILLAAPTYLAVVALKVTSLLFEFFEFLAQNLASIVARPFVSEPRKQDKEKLVTNVLFALGTPFIFSGLVVKEVFYQAPKEIQEQFKKRERT